MTAFDYEMVTLCLKLVAGATGIAILDVLKDKLWDFAMKED